MILQTQNCLTYKSQYENMNAIVSYRVSYVTHLHEKSRMSAPYKLRKWAICKMWANNSDFFLSNFDV